MNVDESGQAQIELIAAIPAMLLAGLIALQLMAVGHAKLISDTGVEAAAIAEAEGRDPGEALEAVGEGLELELDRRGGMAFLEVRVEPPALLPVLRRRLSVTSRAVVRSPGAGG